MPPELPDQMMVVWGDLSFMALVERLLQDEPYHIKRLEMAEVSAHSVSNHFIQQSYGSLRPHLRENSLVTLICSLPGGLDPNYLAGVIRLLRLDDWNGFLIIQGYDSSLKRLGQVAFLDGILLGEPSAHHLIHNPLEIPIALKKPCFTTKRLLSAKATERKVCLRFRQLMAANPNEQQVWDNAAALFHDHGELLANHARHLANAPNTAHLHDLITRAQNGRQRKKAWSMLQALFKVLGLDQP